VLREHETPEDVTPCAHRRNARPVLDLLRQRRALREFGRDPEKAEVRDVDTVERYEQ